MKYSYLILMGLLALAPATYADGNGNIDQIAMNQTNNITVKGKIVDDKGNRLSVQPYNKKAQPLE